MVNEKKPKEQEPPAVPSTALEEERRQATTSSGLKSWVAVSTRPPLQRHTHTALGRKHTQHTECEVCPPRVLARGAATAVGRTNLSVERMSLNRSQCGSCSTKYDTVTGT